MKRKLTKMTVSDSSSLQETLKTYWNQAFVCLNVSIENEPILPSFLSSSDLENYSNSKSEMGNSLNNTLINDKNLEISEQSAEMFKQAREVIKSH